MPTIWGCLDRIEEDPDGVWSVQVKTILPGGTAIRVRVLVEKQTLMARGIQPVALSSLCAGEFVEVTCRHGHAGFMVAETIYARPDRAALSQRLTARSDD